MTRNARLTWPASDGSWKPGCSSIATPSSAERRGDGLDQRELAGLLAGVNHHASPRRGRGKTPTSLRLLDLLVG